MNKNENIERSETNKRKSIVKNKRNIKKVIFSVLFLGAIVFSCFFIKSVTQAKPRSLSVTKLGQELPENAVIMEAKDFDEYLEKLQMILYNPDKYQIMEGSYDKSIIFSVDNQEAKYTCLDTFEDLVSFLLQLKHQEGCKIDIDTDYDFVYFLK